MAKGLLDGVNLKRLLWGIFALFVYVWITDFLIHGLILGKLYKETAQIWRPGMESGQGMIFMLMSQFLTGALFLFIFTKGYQKQGWKEGARYGFVMWLFSMGSTLMQYAVYPLTQEILVSWTITSLVQSVLGGIFASLIYKK